MSNTGRRAFLGHLATGAAASAGMAALASIGIPESLHGAQQGAAQEPEAWLEGLKGKHKQVVDAYSPNEGFPLAFTHAFLATQAPKDTAGAVLVLRRTAMPIVLSDAMWAKYRIGQAFNVIDPATKKPAVKNPFYKPASGVLLVDDMALDRLLARNVIVGACSVALAVLSGQLAANAGVSAEVAKREWTAGLIPGVHLLPSGVWGLNRAQEAGCTYVAGG